MRCAPGPLLAILVFVPVLGALGCSHVDVKGRETFRVAPLRGVAVAPAVVDPVAVDVDAGTDALTDEELTKIANALPQSLAASFDKRATTKRVGTAHIGKCRLRAGPGKSFIVYEARCKLSIDVDGVVMVEAHGEGLVRVDSSLSANKAPPTTTARNPLLSAADSQRALEAALDAAAQIVVDGALPPRDNGPKEAVMPREQSAELARARLAHATASGRVDDVVAALFDLRTHGAPEDASLVVPLLDNNEPQVLAAAIDALGELCLPAARPKLEPFIAGDDATAQSAKRALARLDACSHL